MAPSNVVVSRRGGNEDALSAHILVQSSWSEMPTIGPVYKLVINAVPVWEMVPNPRAVITRQNNFWRAAYGFFDNYPNDCCFNIQFNAYESHPSHHMRGFLEELTTRLATKDKIKAIRIGFEFQTSVSDDHATTSQFVKYFMTSALTAFIMNNVKADAVAILIGGPGVPASWPVDDPVNGTIVGATALLTRSYIGTRS